MNSKQNSVAHITPSDPLSDREQYLDKKYNLIPLSPKLIDHVRRLDSLNHEELVSLRALMTQIAQIMENDFQFQDKEYLKDTKFRRYLENTLKIHQIFALVDVDFSEVFSRERCNQELSSFDTKNLDIVKSHYSKVAEQLKEHNGLNYVPRERNPDGRLFEHASDSRVLIDHLANMNSQNMQMDHSSRSNSHISRSLNKNSSGSTAQSGKTMSDPDMGLYFIQLLDEKDTTDTLDQKVEMNIYKELNLDQPTSQIVMILNRAFIDLSMKAKGKADLYFHAYFWQEYLKTLNDLQNKAKKQGKSKSSPPRKKASSEKKKEEDPQDMNLSIFTDVDLIDEGASKYTFMKRLFGLAATMQKVIVNIKKFPFTQDNYKKYIDGFFQESQRYSNKKNKYLEEIQRALFVAQISNEEGALELIEKLLIQLMGYPDIAVRDQAVVLLNMLYDEVDWQLQEAFRPVIRTVGQHFIINTIITLNQDDPAVRASNEAPELFMCLAAPSPIYGNNQHLVTWHKIEARNILKQDNGTLNVTLNFGKFWKCGFFDWRLYEISDAGRFLPCEVYGTPEPVFPYSNHDQDDMYENERSDDSICLAQGRFIVHARGIRDHTFHEVQVDYVDAQFDKNQNLFLKRGTFKDVENNIDNYAKQGVSALYVMGTLQRDNFPFKNSYTGQTEYRKDDASPLACTSRDQSNKMLGGDEGLKAVVGKAKSRNIKIIVDTLARISSTRHHRKYTDLLLHHLTEEGRRDICYGTDGQAQNYQDTAMLNYRKKKAWDLLIDEVFAYISKTDVDGIHLDNGQAWPQVMQPDTEELQRVDDDGQPAYTPEDFMEGAIVIRNENHGYWNTNIMETYPNPFFIKMTKRIWQQKPNFIFIGECWGGFMFEHRQIIMARSAIIPRMYKLPITISSLFGKKLHKDGRIDNCTKENVIAIKKWYTETRKFLPDGTILMQSSTSHQLPYPAHLYGRGTWAAIDILYFMPDCPITFMGEIDGEVYNIGQGSIFQHQQAEVSTEQTQGMKKSGSKIMLALTEANEEHLIGRVSELNASYLDATAAGGGGGLQRTTSQIRLAASTNVAQSEREFGGRELTEKERDFKKKLDPRRGYDLSKIYSHYLHRRQLRKSKMVLRYGEIFYLTARQNANHWFEDVLAFARYSAMETMIICTNLSEEERTFFVDASALMPTFKQAYQNNTVVMVKDCINDQLEPVYYFLREFLELRETKTLRPYRSSVVSLQIIKDDQYIFKKCLTNSIDRMKRNLITGDSVQSEQISILFSDCVEYNPQDIERFANVIGSIQSSFLDKLNISFDKMYMHNEKLTENAQLSSRLLAMTSYVIEQAGRENQGLAPVRAAKSVFDCNKLGEIVFATPELGRWSTVGGLGVMVDELATGLVKLGQQVTVISPYYERNRKGQTGYLASDPAGIRCTGNIRVTVQNQQVQLGVHEGYERGVRVVFLHNGEVFPAPYQSNGAGHVVFQLAVFNKACLEYCCHRQIQPSVCVTNDWFTGLMAAYVKNGDFGNYFQGSQFLHICHNLQETYEGRIHPHNHEGDLNRVHGLPREWFSDHGSMINPSKCALLQSDQWATVSKSYKQELLDSSSLRHLLHAKPNAFAFPNGVPIGDRLKKLDAAAPDHLTAKKRIQMKYFNYKDLDDSIPLFAFVGRVTAQKGVHLILDCAEGLIERCGQKIQILVGGPANMGEPYSAGCAHKMWHLKNKYPHCFYAAPEEFFTDGSLINRGSDFGLMPSAFEPGGIVQHEFFVGKTPVVAYKTGGLKDSVIEFKWDSEQGSGFTMEHHNPHELGMAVERAVNTFKNKEKYYKLRENAFRATMDGEVVCKAWLSEFCRLTEKNFVDKRIIDETKKTFTKPWNASYYQPISLIKEIFGSEKRNELFCDIDQGATEKMENDPTGDFGSTDASGAERNLLEGFSSPDGLLEIDTIMSSFDKMDTTKKPQVFMLHNRGPRYNRVELCGSMDAWTARHEMQYDQFTNQWFITLHLKVGEEYHYKYVINDQHWVVNDEEPQRKDNSGNVNNYCGIMDTDLM